MSHTSDPVAYEGNRAAGVLLHPTSLPGRYGVGDLGYELTAFLDWASAAGFRIWQTLPLNPPGYGNSPYGCLSSFAGNPLLISPFRLLQERLLPAEPIEAVPPFANERVEFERVAEYKSGLLRIAFEHFSDWDALAAFVEEQRGWLEDFALFMALKQREQGAAWWTWPRGLAQRDEDALAEAREELADEVSFHQFVQFLFFRQWRAVRVEAAARGIRIFGDLPIYVAHDSVDVWANRELFQLDRDGQPTVIAGVPPDYFSETGQRWGNPLYRWDVMHERNYEWWVARVKANLQLADIIRLDHFRGFAAYWEIPANEPTAIHGRWMPGPGHALFDAIRKALGGNLPLIAEDLGFITPEVHELRHAIGIPGMKILQFGFGQIDSPHLPHRYERETVAYTGTHDNDTALSWFTTADDEEQRNAFNYLGVSDAAEVPHALIRAAYTSVAQIAIVPAQDILALGSEGRMNRPGAEHDNWSWRVRAGALTSDLSGALHRLAHVTGRL
ncbi:MAG: 4-alpha-glucanotransferase [Acidobacteria bacterium]|nr:4-alpha-glucanotransferase [Acidobacteriota bacterium]